MLTTMARSGNVVAHPAKSAEEAWIELTALTGPMWPTDGDHGHANGAATARARLLERAERSRQAEAVARNFYLDYPDHASAHLARKIEALAALDAAASGSPVELNDALQIAGKYRKDQSNRAADRFEIAVGMERLLGSSKSGGNHFANNSAELDAMAQRLHDEFGDLPELNAFTAAAARIADETTAVRIAGELLHRPVPADIKRDAETILARQALIGTILPLRVSAVDGRTIDLAAQSGKVTIVFCWSAESPASLGQLSRARPLLPSDAEVILLTSSATNQQLAAAKRRVPATAILCTDANEPPGDVRSVLKLQHLPYVFALDRSGKLAAWGPVNALGSVVAAAAGNRITNP